MKQQGLQAFLQQTIHVWKLAPLLSLVNSVALTLPLTPTSACRGGVAFISAFGAFGFWLMSCRVFSSTFSRLLLLALCLTNPFSFFAERTNLMEPVLVAMALLFIALIFIHTTHPKRVTRLLVVIFLLLMLLAKQNGFLFLPIPFLLLWPHRKKLPHFFTTALWVIPLGFAEFLLLTRLTPLWHTVQIHANFDLTSAHAWLQFKQNTWLLANWLRQYWGTLGMISLFSGMILGLIRKQWSIFLVVVLLVVPTILFGITIFPRYLLLVIPFFVLFLGNLTRHALGQLILILLLFVFVFKDYTIIVHPAQAKIALEDHYQFFVDWGSGIGAEAAIKFLRFHQLSRELLLLVPHDLIGSWVILQQTYAPDTRVHTYFYTGSDDINLQLGEIDLSRPVWLLTSSHHLDATAAIRSQYRPLPLFVSNGEASNSVRIEQLR